MFAKLLKSRSVSYDPANQTLSIKRMKSKAIQIAYMGSTIHWCDYDSSIFDLANYLKSGECLYPLTFVLSESCMNKIELDYLAKALQSGTYCSGLTFVLSGERGHLLGSGYAVDTPHGPYVMKGKTIKYKDRGSLIYPLAKALALGNFRERMTFVLDHNYVSTDEFIFLIKALKSKNAPKHLRFNLSHNIIGDSGALYLAEAIKSDSLPDNTSFDLSSSDTYWQPHSHKHVPFMSKFGYRALKAPKDSRNCLFRAKIHLPPDIANDSAIAKHYDEHLCIFILLFLEKMQPQISPGLIKLMFQFLLSPPIENENNSDYSKSVIDNAVLKAPKVNLLSIERLDSLDGFFCTSRIVVDEEEVKAACSLM